MVVLDMVLELSVRNLLKSVEERLEFVPNPWIAPPPQYPARYGEKTQRGPYRKRVALEPLYRSDHARGPILICGQFYACNCAKANNAHPDNRIQDVPDKERKPLFSILLDHVARVCCAL
jgi:hypothetical protein